MFFEDVELGRANELGSFTFTAEEIKRFALRYDPQPFHIDEEAAARSLYGGLIASGWHVASVWMKLTVASRARIGAARLGPSPGFRNMGWLKPVRAGDTLAFFSEPVEKKTSASRPQWGLVMMSNGARNQAGDLAFRFDGVVFWERRTPQASYDTRVGRSGMPE
jgi:acyl dehydratase